MSRRIILVAVAAALVAAACSGSKSDDSASSSTSTTRPSTTTSTESTTTTLDPVVATKAEVEKAYKAALSVDIELLASRPDSKDPRLQQLYTGDQLHQIEGLYLTYASHGWIAAVPPHTKSSVVVQEVTLKDATTAAVLACVVDDRVVKEKATGRVLNDKIATSRIRATMKRVDERWKLAEQILEKKWTGVTACDG